MSLRLKVYLAGPMRGYPRFNEDAFIEGAAVLREYGYDVWSPYEDNIANGLDTHQMSGNQEEAERVRPLRECLAADLEWICLHADGVVVLEGWEKSLGAKAETATAHALGLPVWAIGSILAYGTNALEIAP